MLRVQEEEEEEEEEEKVPAILGAAHVGLTVRDMDASAQWYQTVFGWNVVGRFVSGERGTPRVLLYDPTSLFALSLCEPEDRSADSFDYRRTGLDHLAFEVADEEQLDHWVEHLDRLSVAHSPVRDVGDVAKFVAFDDPD
ncbi:MAG TPA: VOC family protein, partial [Acidimicrobiales bacterium]|nr:VOC family protein [Acidimicrobiales bacterium]